MRRIAIPLLLVVSCLVRGAEVPIYERPMPTDPEGIKQYMAELEKALKQVNAAPKKETARARTAVGPTTRPLDIAIPDRDEAEIALANRRLLSDQTIVSDVADLTKRLRAGLDQDDVSDAKRWIEKFGSKPDALASGAAFAWVQGAPGTALLLAAEAATRAPKDTNILNTLGSLLSDAGYGSRGIPILAYLAKKFPDDPTLQNNLGQAWLGLGEAKKAEFHLEACLRLAPGHGAAHASMGVIKEAAGDHGAAMKHFQTAASNSGSAVARRALRRRNEGHAIPRSFRRLAPVREFFNPRQFVVPAAAASMAECETKVAEVNAFQALVRGQIERASTLSKEASEALTKRITTRPDLDYLATLGGGASGLASVPDPQSRMRRAVQFSDDVARAVEEMNALWAQGEAKVAELRRAFRERWKNAELGEGGKDNAAFEAASKQVCDDERTIMDNQWRPIARRYDELVATVSTRERVGINEVLTYLPLMAAGDLYHQEFYNAVTDHLGRVARLAGANPIRRYQCGPNPLAGAFNRPEGEVPGLGGCPIQFSAKFAGLKLNGDCKSLGVDFEAGLKFSAKKDFRSGETTLKGGVGLEMELSDVGQVEGGGAFVVVWDRGNDLSFVGVESGASATLAGIPGLEREFKEGDVTFGAKLPMTGTPDIVKVGSETTLGVTLGPRGVEPTLRGSAGIEVLGRDLVRASL